MTENNLSSVIESKRSFGKAISQRISEAIVKLGFSVQTPIKLPVFENAEFRLILDPLTQESNLAGYWYNDKKQRIGQIQFNSDGSFYAEYDVVQPHPSKKQFFVEAINAWGREDNIKTEAKLLELPQ
ncbi:MAG: hypothetical protein PHQ03_11960 [Methylococcales bacterium]|nr:hypothetical protein [Methylococcales bacterium]